MSATTIATFPVILGAYAVYDDGVACRVTLREFGNETELFKGDRAAAAAFLHDRAGVTEPASVLEARILGARYGHPAQDVLPGYRSAPVLASEDPEARWYALHDGWVS